MRRRPVRLRPARHAPRWSPLSPGSCRRLREVDELGQLMCVERLLDAGSDAAALQPGDAIAGVRKLLKVARDQDHAGAAGRGAPDELVDLAAGANIHALRRLVNLSEAAA